MKKVIRDGKVGVLVSSGFGAGFFSWGAPMEAIFDPILIELVEKKYNMEFKPNDTGGITQDVKVWKTSEYKELVNEMVEYVTKTYEGVYEGGIQDLVVEWIPEGKEFIIEEYDGSESLILKEDYNWIKS